MEENGKPQVSPVNNSGNNPVNNSGEKPGDKPPKKGFFSNLRNGFKKAVDSIGSTFVQPDSETTTEDVKGNISQELVQKLASYCNGIEPVLSDIVLALNNTDNEYTVSAKVSNLQSSASGKQEADLTAEIVMPDAGFLHIPVPGAYGIDTLPATPLPVYDFRPRIKKINLEITDSNARAEVGLNNIQESVKNRYPDARLLDKNTPQSLGNEDAYCERFVVDAVTDSRGRKNYLLRQLRFPLVKASVEKAIDEVLVVRDFDFKLGPPENLFTLNFPGTSDIVRILSRDKNTIRNLIFADLGRGMNFTLSKLFFKIIVKESFRTVEPKDISTDHEIAFDVDFSCITGFGSTARSSNVSTVLYYTTVTDFNKKGEKTIHLRFLKRDNFKLSQA